MKLLIATRANNDIRTMTNISHPLLQDYAEKCGADFKVLSSVCEIPHAYMIMELKEILNDYDRILNIDSDVIINKGCPNIFDVVPEDHIGTIFEDKGSRKADRKKRIEKAQHKFGNVGWVDGYINTGVFVVSKQHKDIFDKINGEYWADFGYDDVHLGWQIKHHNIKIKELPYLWNHMTMFSEEWNGNANRFDSYIIHYAGNGTYNAKNRIEQMSQDKRSIYGN